MYNHVQYMAVVLNSFICKRPLFAKKKLSRIFREPNVSLSRGSHVKNFRSTKSFAKKNNNTFANSTKKLLRVSCLVIKNPYVGLVNDFHMMYGSIVAID